MATNENTLTCRFCKNPIVHDGGHWSLRRGNSAVIDKVRRETEDFQDKQQRRNCPSAPTMVRFHSPDVSDVQAARRGTCIPEIPR